MQGLTMAIGIMWPAANIVKQLSSHQLGINNGHICSYVATVD